MELKRCKICGSPAETWLETLHITNLKHEAHCSDKNCNMYYVHGFSCENWNKLNDTSEFEEMKLKLDESRKECQRHQYLERRVCDGLKCYSCQIQCKECSNHDEEGLIQCAAVAPTFFITELEAAADDGLPAEKKNYVNGSVRDLYV